LLHKILEAITMGTPAGVTGHRGLGTRARQATQLPCLIVWKPLFFLFKMTLFFILFVFKKITNYKTSESLDGWKDQLW
jgi:hypothetical protein